MGRQPNDADFGEEWIRVERTDHVSRCCCWNCCQPRSSQFDSCQRAVGFSGSHGHCTDYVN